MKKFFSKVWEYIKIARVELIVLAAVLVVDLVTKAIVAATVPFGSVITLIPKFLHITYSLNPAAAFGGAFGLDKVLGDLGVKIVLLIITGLAMAFFSVFLYRIRGKHITGRLGLALLIGGALGNFIDRIFIEGGVRDFISIEYFGLDIPWLGTHFATFNIADVGVTVGVVIFIVYIIFFADFLKDKKAEEKSDYVLVEGDAQTENPITEQTDVVESNDMNIVESAEQTDSAEIVSEPTSEDKE